MLFQFEERKYEGGQKWISHKTNFKMNGEKKVQNEMFMSLFNYITGKNETGELDLSVKSSFYYKGKERFGPLLHQTA